MKYSYTILIQILSKETGSPVLRVIPPSQGYPSLPRSPVPLSVISLQSFLFLVHYSIFLPHSSLPKVDFSWLLLLISHLTPVLCV